MIRAVSLNGEPLPEPKVTITEVTDPVEIARILAVGEAFQRNSDWIEKHWSDVIPHGYGKCLAVAGQEAFLADSVEEVVRLAEAAHPDDKGIFVQYLIPPGTMTIYGVHG